MHNPFPLPFILSYSTTKTTVFQQFLQNIFGFETKVLHFCVLFERKVRNRAQRTLFERKKLQLYMGNIGVVIAILCCLWYNISTRKLQLFGRGFAVDFCVFWRLGKGGFALPTKLFTNFQHLFKVIHSSCSQHLCATYHNIWVLCRAKLPICGVCGA